MSQLRNIPGYTGTEIFCRLFDDVSTCMILIVLQCDDDDDDVSSLLQLIVQKVLHSIILVFV